MKEQWAQAQKDAAHLSNFLQSLVKAQEVFARVAQAEVVLVNLLSEVEAAKGRLKGALSDAVQAEADSQQHVEAAEASRVASEASLGDFQLEVAVKSTALEEEAERDRLAFVELTAKLATQRKSAEEENETYLTRLAASEEAARISLAAVNQQREQMIKDLS